VTTLSDAADMLVGFAFKSAGFLDEDADGPRLVRGDNVQQGYLRWGDKTKRWSSADLDGLERYQLAEGDVLLAMDRPIVGDGLKMAWVTQDDLPAMLVQRVCRLRGKAGIARTEFLRYVLSAPDFSAHIHRITTGANIPHISGRDIGSYEFELPPLSDQDLIAFCLKAYDDLIATNQRRIALLEQAARLLYREWFVQLRFPGHDFSAVVDGLPAGWHKRSLAEVADVNSRSIGARDKPDSVLYIDISSVSTGQIEGVTPYAFAEAPGRARRLVAHGDVIWSCVRPNRRSYALIWEPDEKLVASTGFAVISATRVPFAYLYMVATEATFVSYLEQNATGAAYPAVTAKTFEAAKILVPTTEVLAAFSELINPNLEQTETLKSQNKQLARARDLMLPKLMSCQFDVSRV
jgi:type I restriction enzyme, S subunit